MKQQIANTKSLFRK